VLYVCPTYRNGKPRTLPAASWLCVLRTTVNQRETHKQDYTKGHQGGFPSHDAPHWLYKKIKNLISGQLSGSEVNTPFQTVT